MAFRLPEVTRCCFVFPLRTGALIIGYLVGLGTLFNLLATIGVLVLVPRVVRDHPPSLDGHHIDRAAAIKIYVTFGIFLALQVVHLALDVMLIVGVHKNISRYLRYYYIAAGAALVATLVMICVTALFNGFYVSFAQMVGCAIWFYFLLVVHSAWADMVRQEKPEPEVELGARTYPDHADVNPSPAPPAQASAAPLIARP